MIKKSLFLTAFGLLPMFANSSPVVAANMTNTSYNVQEEQQSDEECSVMYVGKDFSNTGTAIIARSSDAGPTGMNLNTRLFKHNELANKVVKGKNGFEWQMPSTTYKYISTPRNPSVNKGLHWEASGINEKGVGISGVLTCHTNQTAWNADQILPEGITEDNITQILSATATSARDAMEYLAEIIDQKGSAEQNIILATDKNETWCMETYTGKQYIAIKMPDDKACTIGNEFMFDSLARMFNGNVNWDNVIYSDDLFELPKRGNPDKGIEPFAVYDTGHQETKENEYLDLFHTYARALSQETEEEKNATNYSHRRTWRGLDLFSDHESGDPEKTYHTDVKYDAFFTPRHKLGIQEIKVFMRDRFENILEDTQNPNHHDFFQDYEKGLLRFVGIETAYQIHIITVHPELPDEIAVEEWLCISNANYAPFVPISNGVERINDYYTHESEGYSFDSQAAYCVYKTLNTLSAYNREYYGLSVQYFWEYLENNVWKPHWDQLMQQIQTLSLDKAKEALTNYTVALQQNAIEKAVETYEDLLWHIINDYTSYEPKQPTPFIPYLDLETVANKFGWTYEKNDNLVTLTHEGQDNVYIDFNYKWNVPGKIKTEPMKDWEECDLVLRDGRTRINWETARDYLGITHLIPLDVNDYLNKPSNNLGLIISLSTVIPLVAIAAAITPIMIMRNKKKKHKAVK